MEEQAILRIELRPNRITEREDDFTGNVRTTGTIRNADIARRITEKRSEYRPETIENILNLSDKEKQDALAHGKGVIDLLGYYRLTVTGNFIGSAAPFDPRKHTLNVSFTMSKQLREQLAATQKQTTPAAGTMAINEIIDSSTQEVNNHLTSGKPAIINGACIKIAGNDPSVGVFLTPEGGNPIKSEMVIHNNPSQLTILLPTLPPGKYLLHVTTRYASNTSLLKSPRTYQLPITLLVSDKENGPESERPEEI